MKQAIHSDTNDTLFDPLSGRDMEALADMVMSEALTNDSLEPHIRAALIDTAATFAKHGLDCSTAEAVADQLLHRIGSTGDTLD